MSYHSHVYDHIEAILFILHPRNACAGLIRRRTLLAPRTGMPLNIVCTYLLD